MTIASPFNAVHERLGANFKEYHGWSLPGDYGNANLEADALNDGCCAFDLSSFGKIELKGAGSTALLEILTGHSLAPENNKWVWSKIASADNECIVRISNASDGYILFTQPEDRQQTLALIHKHIEENDFEDVKTADITEKTGMLGIYGPRAIEVIGKIIPFDISGIGENGVMNMNLFMISVTILRGSWIGCDGYEVLCPSMACGMAASAVEKYHKQERITPAGMECLTGKLIENVKSMRKSV